MVHLIPRSFMLGGLLRPCRRNLTDRTVMDNSKIMCFYDFVGKYVTSLSVSLIANSFKNEFLRNFLLHEPYSTSLSQHNII